MHQGISPLTSYANVTFLSNLHACLHSWTGSFSPPTSTSSFWDQIGLYNNHSLWQNHHCNGDGSWIWEGLCLGSLIIIHDHSYMEEVSPHISSAAVMILCNLTCCTCKCTMAKYSADAGSYRGEILGAILAQLFLPMAVQGQMGPYLIITEDCDNKGVVRHGNTPHRTLSTNQPHVDVLVCWKDTFASLSNSSTLHRTWTISNHGRNAQ